MSGWRKAFKEFFKIGGRLSRERYCLCIMIFWIPFITLSITQLLIDDVFELREQLPNLIIVLSWLKIIVGGFLFFGFVLLTPRRLHDFDKSGWWTAFFILMIFIQNEFTLILILIFSLWVSNMKGTEGRNKYGEQPPDD